MEATILPLTYLGNILYYSLLISRPCIIDVHSHYQRQTYTNRTTIISSCGKQNLSIPIETQEEKTIIADVRISTHNDWQQQHWRSFETAYRSTPFYQYYKEELRSFYEEKFENLTEFNLKIQSRVLELLDYTDTKTYISTEYITKTLNNVNDYREVINPKKFNVSLYHELSAPYYQVFDEKFGFTPNLSIVDLLFNMGNEARIYLKKLSEHINS